MSQNECDLFLSECHWPALRAQRPTVSPLRLHSANAAAASSWFHRLLLSVLSMLFMSHLLRFIAKD